MCIRSARIHFLLASLCCLNLNLKAFALTYSSTVLQLLKHSSQMNSSTRSSTMQRHISPLAASTARTIQTMSSEEPSKNLKVAIIGAGAAGLATARVFSRNGYRPRIYEASSSMGGVWNYHAQKDESTSSKSPMYAGLRTNLPRELMQFREFPWGNNGLEPSFVTHETVQSYLKDYTDRFDLEALIQYNCRVTQLTMEEDENVENSEGKESRKCPISLEWEQQEETNTVIHQKETYDVVCVCNGHYNLPSIPTIPGLKDHFKGSIRHSKSYDTPLEFQDQVVLCVGGRASGADLAREISMFAKQVYLSDSTCPIGEGKEGVQYENIVWVPKTKAVEEGSKVVFERDCLNKPSDVDTIVFCTGYDYEFPFINEKSNLDLGVQPGERRVMPLYEQLWHARHTNLAFVGLPHSVVPFPLFELQAEAIVAQLQNEMEHVRSPNRNKILPDLKKRLIASEKDADSGGPNTPGRVQDTHFLGSHQWAYLVRYAEYAGVWDESLKQYIQVNEMLYNHSNGQRKAMPPGGVDEYRYNSYIRDDENGSIEVKSFWKEKIGISNH